MCIPFHKTVVYTLDVHLHCAVDLTCGWYDDFLFSLAVLIVMLSWMTFWKMSFRVAIWAFSSRISSGYLPLNRQSLKLHIIGYSNKDIQNFSPLGYFVKFFRMPRNKTTKSNCTKVLHLTSSTWALQNIPQLGSLNDLVETPGIACGFHVFRFPEFFQLIPPERIVRCDAVEPEII